VNKLLILLLLSLSFVTLAADVNYRLVGSQLRGDDGSTCRLVGNQWRCQNVKGDSKWLDDDDDWGWGSNRIKYFVDDGPYDYDKAAQGLRNILNWLNNNTKTNTNTSSSSKGIPPNAYKYGNSWKCVSGYERHNNGCRFLGYKSTSSSSKKIPPNAHSSGSSWICNTNYYRNSGRTGCIKVPANAFSPYDSNDWSCRSTYKKSGNSCIKNFYIPPNAYGVGNSWKCNSGYVKIGISCIKEEIPYQDESIKYLEKIKQVKALLDGGIITEEEFEKIKQRIIKEGEEEQYNQLLFEEIQAEQDLAQELITEDQLNTLKSAYVNNIAARVKSFWRYQGAKDGWGCTVYVRQDIDGRVEAVNIQNCTLDNSEMARAFKNSIERAVYKASPLPSAPDDAVFSREIMLFFRVN